MVPADWIDYANCASENPDIFFPEDYRTSSVLRDAATYKEELQDPSARAEAEAGLKVLAAEAEDSAKGICTGCPVRLECLRYALENDERYGIWGGENARERRQISGSVQQRAS